MAYYYLVKASTATRDAQGEVLRSWQDIDGPVDVWINHNGELGVHGQVLWGEDDPEVGLVVVMRSELELAVGTPVSVGAACMARDDASAELSDCKLLELSIVRGLSTPVNPEAMVYGVLKSSTGNDKDDSEVRMSKSVETVKATPTDGDPVTEVTVDVVKADNEDIEDKEKETEEDVEKADAEGVEAVQEDEHEYTSDRGSESHYTETVVEHEVSTTTMDANGNVETETERTVVVETDSTHDDKEEVTMTDTNEVVVTKAAPTKTEPSIVRKASTLPGNQTVRKAMGPEVIAEFDKYGLWANVDKRAQSTATASIADIPIGEAWKKLDGCELDDCTGVAIRNIPMAIYGCRITVCEDDIDDDTALVTEVMRSLRFGGMLALEDDMLNGDQSGDGLRGILGSAYTTTVEDDATAGILGKINNVLAGVDGHLRPFATVVLSPRAYADFKTALLANPGACCLTDGGASFFENSVVVAESLEDYTILAVYLPAYKARIRRDMTFGNCQPCGDLTRILSGSLRASGMLTGGVGVAAKTVIVVEEGDDPPGEGGTEPGGDG